MSELRGFINGIKSWQLRTMLNRLFENVRGLLIIVIVACLLRAVGEVVCSSAVSLWR